MSIESITARIRNEAETYSEDQKAEAEKLKKVTLEDAKAKAEIIKANSIKKAEEDSKLLISRRDSVAGLEARKMKLAAKQELIEECFSEALKELLSLEPDNYIEFMMDQLQEYKAETGEILLNSNDKEKYEAELNKKLKDTSLQVSEDTVDIQGGFILRKGNISYNASLEKLLENAKVELTSEVAGILFPAK